MTDFVAWFGPVAAFQVPGAVLPGAETMFFSCTGDGAVAPRCADMAASLGYPKFSMLDDAAEQVKLGDSTLGAVVLVAYSAGGAVIRRLLERPEDRQRVGAVVLLDATYSDWASPGVPRIEPSWVDFGAEVAADPSRLFVATASPSPNHGLPTAVETLREMRSQIERRVGKPFEKLSHFAGIEPSPEAAYRLGGIWFAEYGMQPLGHGHHQLAKQVFERLVVPWRTDPVQPGYPKRPQDGADDSPWMNFVLLVAGLVAGYNVVKDLTEES
jgi:pimeloyl-ACP methyl ester carboxylesterase